MITLALVGDVMLGRLVNQRLKTMSADEVWGDVLPQFAAADLRIGNLECALTEHRPQWERTRKVFHFRAAPSAVRVLRAAHIDAVSLANNHTLDFEEQGLLDTITHLDKAGIRHAGAGHNLETATATALIPVKGQQVALIAVTDNEPAFAASATTPGTHYLPVSTDGETLDYVEGLIRRARDEGADLVVFSNHWGPNMVNRPSALFRRFAHAVIERGADVYYGHSAHLFQGVEIHRGKPILYSTGDFVDDYAVDPWLHNDWSFLFQVGMEGGLLRRLVLYPVLLTVAHVRRAEPPERPLICKRMRELSAELGTMLHEEHGILSWQAGSISVPA
ncbi:CapA family protein [Crenobacter sp. SG2303]|uniref:CapA family protein n=1 Tax=Crenobacter oryzisoli TaxID=3056844 RepID=A0ABT7XV05_9NEIS|nr:CapA family protein [Crenobacter sp. SG2303]MDN0077616.1 CapA family protein [Crenobacter sp. SG2303]